jgi:hypothetical protein
VCCIILGKIKSTILAEIIYFRRMPTLAITRLRIRRIWFLPRFFRMSMLSLKQAKNSEGIIAVNVFNDAFPVFWTCSIWESEQHMMNYMKSGDHKKAMPYLQKWCNEARTCHVSFDSNIMPAASELALLLHKHGRASRLLKPNENHLKEIFPEPVFKTE